MKKKNKLREFAAQSELKIFQSQRDGNERKEWQVFLLFDERPLISFHLLALDVAKFRDGI